MPQVFSGQWSQTNFDFIPVKGGNLFVPSIVLNFQAFNSKAFLFAGRLSTNFVFLCQSFLIYCSGNKLVEVDLKFKCSLVYVHKCVLFLRRNLYHPWWHKVCKHSADCERRIPTIQGDKTNFMRFCESTDVFIAGYDTLPKRRRNILARDRRAVRHRLRTTQCSWISNAVFP